jgi:MATE family multidrug resistance protein
MENPHTATGVSYASIIRLTAPIILANMAVPLLGLVDTAIMGHSGSASDLGAIALGSLIFTFVFWLFGFLRMSTTGFTAQALGAGDLGEARAIFGRAILLGSGIGIALILAQFPIIHCALWLLGGSDKVETQVAAYWDIRIWAAPATLMTYAIMGTLIGLGKTRHLLLLQLCLNGTNLILDVFFVVGLDWGVKGIAAGTLIAEWISALVGFWMVTRHLSETGKPFWNWPILIDRNAFARTLSTNADIMWRTLFLLGGFAFFSNQGAKFGDTALAANHILLQIISFSAFFLDGFAFAVESLVGRALGIRNRELFDRVIGLSTRLAAITAFILTLIILFAGNMLIESLTSITTVKTYALIYLPYAACYVFVSFAAFQLDGIFIGATRSRAMRNASFISLMIFLFAFAFMQELENHGLWIAFIIYVSARAVTLGHYYPALRREIHQP